MTTVSAIHSSARDDGGLSRTAIDLTRFIAQAQASQGAAIDRWELHQVVGDGQYSRVDGWPGQPAIVAKELAAAVDEAATSDAAALGGLQSYALVWYRRGDNAHAGRKTFRKSGNAIDGTAPSEGPNATGLVQQAQRHLEAMAFQYTEATAETIDQLRRTVRAVERDNHILRKELRLRDRQSRELLETERDLVLETHTRSLETSRVEAQEKRKDLVAQMAVGQLARFVPVFLSKFAPVAGALGGAPKATEPAAANDATPSPGAPGEGQAVVTPPPRTGPEAPMASAVASVIDFLKTLDEPAFFKIREVLTGEQRDRFEAVALAVAAAATAEGP